MMSREYPDRPWVGVGVVVWSGDAVLLVRRAHAPRQGHWSIPGGMQELGETAQQAGVREVREETGIEIRIDGLIDVIDLILPDETGRVRTHYTLIDYYGACLRDSTPLSPGDDADAAEWVKLDALEKYELWPQTLQVIYASHGMRESRSGPCNK
ncbi:MAG: NUDIX domain-containing protein [Alphaproteobacteria bacterium]|nr:NUDIX domain-containing protein [Alphaproteobacteria bacterium]